MYEKFYEVKTDEDHKMVDEIVERIGDKQISPAQLQGWFIQHMYSPPQVNPPPPPVKTIKIVVGF